MEVGNAVVDEIFAKYEGKDAEIQNLPEPDRSVILSVSAQAIIDTGGFITFFEDDIEANLDFQVFVDAYRRIGMDKLADNLSEVLALFPGGKPQPDLNERQLYLARFFEDESPEYINIIGALENAFFDNNDAIYQGAAAYCEAM
ncbi:MAG: hypothetical protein COA38_18445 [Fluviicola sp.]|nr:MAG: hypothetical protein COA38_18445 [Fluviicola sp.]